jgi:hypothetical protein
MAEKERQMTLKSEKIKILMEFWDKIAHGTSEEELIIMTDIYDAGGKIPQKVCEAARVNIKLAAALHEEGMTRKEVLGYLQETLS